MAIQQEVFNDFIKKNKEGFYTKLFDEDGKDKFQKGFIKAQVKEESITWAFRFSIPGFGDELFVFYFNAHKDEPGYSLPWDKYDDGIYMGFIDSFKQYIIAIKKPINKNHDDFFDVDLWED